MKTDHLIIDGKKYVSTRRAAEIAKYSADYVGQLCRTGKIERRMINRVWYVEEESILRHSEQAFKANHTSFKKEDFSQGVESTYVSGQSRISGGVQALLLPAPSISATYRYALQVQRKNWKVLKTSLLLAALCLIVVAGVTVSVGRVSENSGITNTNESSVASVAQAWNSFFGRVMTFFGKGSVGTTQNNLSSSDGSSDDLAHGGLVVVPSADTSAGNAKLASAISNSFSDPVKVVQTGNGNSGVITPEFRTIAGHDFLYVLVPVKTASTSQK